MPSLHIAPAGDCSCRPLSRGRTEMPAKLGLPLATQIGEQVPLVMIRRMLHGIKQRTERRISTSTSRATL